jgi:PAS domain S-box-containing protein
MIATVLSPKIAQPYLFGLHQCSGPRVWTPTEERLFQGIGRRLEDALTSVLIFRSLRDSERRLEEAQRIAHVGYWDRDLDAGRITLSDEGCRIFGLRPEDRVVDLTAWDERWHALIHPEDRPRAVEAAAAALAGGPRYDVQYRVVHRDGEVRIVHSQGDVIRDESGRPCRMFGIMQDITERKRAEAELRASEERFRTLVQFSFDVYWESDAQHRFTRQEFAQGLTDAPAPGSEIGKTRWEVPYLEPDEDAWRQHRATLDAHLPFRDFELARPTPDGGKCYMSVSGLPVFDETGCFRGYRGVGRHITDRKRAEEALRQSEAYLAEAQRLSHTGSWAFDVASDKYVYASEECLRIFELDAQGGLPRREAVSGLIHPQDWDKVKGDFETTLREKVDTSSEFRIVLPSGMLKHVQAIRHPVLNDTGDVVRLLGTVIDITERKRAEEALRRSEAYLAEGQRLSHAGSWAWNPLSEQCFYWSEEMFRIFEIDPQQGLPTSEIFWARIHPEDRESMRELLGKSALEKTEYVHDHRILLPDGTVKHIHAIGHPVLHEAGELVEFIGTAIDVTERKRAEEERERLRQLEADLAHINRVSMMGELAASIAHEVNQPLSGVVSNANACLRWLAGDAPNLEEVREAARRIVRDGKRAAEVIARIRALAKRAETPKERLDLNETMREVLVLVGDVAKRKSVNVRMQFADDLSPVSGDQVQLQQVVLNLVMNGIEAMSGIGERPRELIITTQNIEAGEVQVTVEDTGTGLDPDVRDKIFDSFYTTKPGGMGMGLAISRSILEAHGGRLWATAKDGPGTVFHFTLPRYHEEESNA